MSKNEFERIETYFAPLAAGFDGALSLKDDAAVLAVEAGRELVVTTDTIVEGVHYIGDETPDLIARKLLRVSLSDLAAMGADPIAYTLNVALPRGTGDDWLEAFAGGLRADQDAFGIHLAGGDSVSTPGAAVLTATLFGSVPAGMAVRRSGASPGDVIFVSGTMGVSAFGLAAAQGALSADKSDIDALEARYRLPLPRVNLGGCLRGNRDCRGRRVGWVARGPRSYHRGLRLRCHDRVGKNTAFTGGSSACGRRCRSMGTSRHRRRRL